MQRRYAGIDLHRSFSVITIMDEEGNCKEPIKIYNSEPDNFIKLLNSDDYHTTAVVEATYGWYWLADLLDNYKNITLKLGHAFAIKKIARNGHKTDKNDSKLLANLARVNILPESHIVFPLMREVKEMVRARHFLVSKRASIKIKIRDITAKINVRCKYADISSKSAREWIKENIKKYPYNFQVETYLNSIDSLNKQIAKYDKEILKYSKIIPAMNIIKTVPGIGNYTGLIILSEIDNISRFPDPKKLCNYAGLTPTIYSSGNKSFNGKITKGSPLMKWALAEAVTHAIKSDTWLKIKYEELRKVKCTSVAKVAIMRKLLTSIYFVLSKNERYIPRPIVSTELIVAQSSE